MEYAVVRVEEKTGKRRVYDGSERNSLDPSRKDAIVETARPARW